MWKQLATTLILLLTTSSLLYAGPALKDFIDVQQPDGTHFKARKHGDEFQNWTETESGHTIIRNRHSSEWEYAEQNLDGTLRESGITVIPNRTVPAHIPKKLKPPRNIEAERSRSQSLQKMHQQRAPGASASSVQSSSVTSYAPGDWNPIPVSGTQKIIMILVNFTNRSLITTASGWSSSIFSTAAGVKSVANYYRDNSFSTLLITPLPHTQPGSPAGVITVSVPHVHPYNGTAESVWVAAAINAASSYINFADMDANNNGFIDQSEALIYLIPAGYEESGSNKTPSVWGHTQLYSGGGLAAAGKTFTAYAINGELNNSGIQHPIGVIAHEMGHLVCGLPDLYDLSDRNQAMGLFSLMADGSWGQDTGEASAVTPTNLDAWSREYLGWASPVTPTSATTLFLAHPLSSVSAVYKLVSPSVSTSEYFLIENRQPVGWDRGIRGRIGSGWSGGLLVTHIDITSRTVDPNDINNYTVTNRRQGVVPVQASTARCDMLSDGATCPGDASTLFYAPNNADLTPFTTPNTNFYNGSASNFSLSGISVPMTTMTGTLAFAPQVNGSCGTSNGGTFSIVPAFGLCTTGVASSVTGSGPWYWNCDGSEGGVSVACSARIQTLNVNATVTGGNGSVSCTSPVAYGSSSTCTVTPSNGYQLATFTDNSFTATGSVTGGRYIIPNVTDTHSIKATFSLIADTTKPEISSFSIPATSRSLTVPVISLIASDNVAVAAYLLTESATAPSAASPGWSSSSPTSYSFVSAGSKTLYAWVKDVAGNVSANLRATVNVDITAPALSLATLANGAVTNNATLNVSGTVSDTSGVAGLTINNTSVTVTNGSFIHPFILQAGANAIRIVATDTLGNTTIDTRTITLDISAPVLNISSPADNINSAQPFAVITGTINKSATVTIKVNSSTPHNASIAGNSFNTNEILSPGINTLDITATDLAGNTSAVRRTVIFDNSAPSLTVSLPGQGITTAHTTFTIGGTATDSITRTTLKISVDGQNLAPAVASDGTFSQTLTLPVTKTYTVVVTATDLAGNTASLQRTITRIAALAQPTISDALKVLQAVVGITQLTATEQIRYDVAPLESGGAPYGNGVIDAADVILILRRSIGIGSW
jgi:M6 family metalloprotease-like protein